MLFHIFQTDCKSNGRWKKKDLTKNGKKKSVRKRKRASWKEEHMVEAINRIEDGEITIGAASREYGIPKSTIRGWLYGKVTRKKEFAPRILTLEEENDIVSWCLEQAEIGHGVTLVLLKARVAEVCANKPTSFKNGVPSTKWWRSFKRRHPQLSLRSCETLDVARVNAINKSNLDFFYTSLEPALSLVKFDPRNIWNCDETGVQAGKVSGLKIIARKGARNVSETIMRNREWVTILCCCNAAGHLMPNFYIFKGKRIRANHIMGCEQGASMAIQEEAWMTKDLFKQWINNHFARNVPGGVSLDNPHLLILDGHASHVDIEVIEAAKSIGLHLFVLPPHTSYKLQPLDVSCYSPFKTAFKRMRGKYMRVNKKVEPGKEDLASMIWEAIRAALTPQNIKSGFKATGIHPFNKLVVQDNRDVMVAANCIATNNDCATTSNADVANAIILVSSDPHEDHVNEATCNTFVPPSPDLSNANNLPRVALPEANIDANANLPTSHMAQQAHNIVVNIASPMSSLVVPVNNSFPLTITFIINGFSATSGASNIDLVPSTSRDAQLQSQPSQFVPSISGDVQLQPQHPQQSQPSQLGPSISGDVQLQPQDTQQHVARKRKTSVNLTGLVTCDEFVAAADKERARKLEAEKVKLQKAEERRKESQRKKAAKEALQKEVLKRKEDREAKRRATQLGK